MITRVIAAGTDLLELIKGRAARPERLLDINGLPDMRRIAARPDRGLRIGRSPRSLVSLRGGDGCVVAGTPARPAGFPDRPFWDGRSRCFPLLFPELSASEIPFSAEILDRRQSRERKDSENTRCSLAVSNHEAPRKALGRQFLP